MKKKSWLLKNIFLACAKIRVDDHDYEPNLTFVRWKNTLKTAVLVQ